MNESEIKVVISKTINAPVEQVFDAWTQPDVIKQWFAPGEKMTVPETRVDLKVDGEYLIHMHDPDSNTDHIVSGTYEEIIPNEKLVFNWMWKEGVDRTQVTVNFSSLKNNQTQVTLTHRGFSQQEFADKHNQGWGGCLSNLESFYG